MAKNTEKKPEGGRLNTDDKSLPISPPYEKYILVVYPQEDYEWQICLSEWLDADSSSSEDNENNSECRNIKLPKISSYKGELDLNKKISKIKDDEWTLGVTCKIIATGKTFDELLKPANEYQKFGKINLDKSERHALKIKKSSDSSADDIVQKKEKQSKNNKDKQKEATKKKQNQQLLTDILKNKNEDSTKSTTKNSKEKTERNATSTSKNKSSKDCDRCSEKNKLISALETTISQQKEVDKLKEGRIVEMEKYCQILEEKQKEDNAIVERLKEEIKKLKQEIEDLKPEHTAGSSKKGQGIKRKRSKKYFQKYKPFSFTRVEGDTSKYDFGDGVTASVSVINNITAGSNVCTMIREFITVVMQDRDLSQYSLTGKTSNLHKKKNLPAKKPLPSEILAAIRSFVHTIFKQVPEELITKTIRSHLSNSSTAARKSREDESDTSAASTPNKRRQAKTNKDENKSNESAHSGDEPEEEDLIEEKQGSDTD